MVKQVSINLHIYLQHIQTHYFKQRDVVLVKVCEGVFRLIKDKQNCCCVIMDTVSDLTRTVKILIVKVDFTVD